MSFSQFSDPTECGNYQSNYRSLLKALLTYGHSEVNRRTGEIVRVIPGGVSFRIDLHNGYLPVPGTRRVHPATAAAEVAWFLQGEKDSMWLQGYTAMWNKFVERDGRTVANAYGYRWRKHFGRDQIKRAITTLLDDRTSRQIVVSAWDPSSDGLGEKSKNFPCPTHFTFSVTGNALHSSLFLRSSDVFVGLPYDVMGHSLLMAMMSVELGLRLGVLHVTLAHAHLYVKHHEMAVRCSELAAVDSRILMPFRSLQWVESNPGRFVEDMKDAQAVARWPNYNPKPEVIE